MATALSGLARPAAQCRDDTSSIPLPEASLSVCHHQPRRVALLQIRPELQGLEDLLAERGITVSYETIRQWCHTFGLAYAKTALTPLYVKTLLQAAWMFS